MRKPTDKTALVTHRGCLDGTGSAAVFIWSGGKRSNVLFRTPHECHLSPEEAASFDEVWFVDVCPQSLEDPAGGKPFWVCDHHATNVRRHGDDPRCTFCMNHCGTSLLARETGYIDEGWTEQDLRNDRWRDDRWKLIKGLEAYDLGRFDDWIGLRLADAAGSMSQEEMLDKFLHEGTGIWYNDEIAYRAIAMEGARQEYVQKAAESALYLHFVPPGGKYRAVPTGVAVAPMQWKNAVAEALLERAELAVVVDSTTWSLSFRSHKLDVSGMAQEFGGGGHKRAAGFKISSHDSLRALLEEIFE